MNEFWKALRSNWWWCRCKRQQVEPWHVTYFPHAITWPEGSFLSFAHPPRGLFRLQNTEEETFANNLIWTPLKILTLAVLSFTWEGNGRGMWSFCYVRLVEMCLVFRKKKPFSIYIKTHLFLFYFVCYVAFYICRLHCSVSSRAHKCCQKTYK